MIPRMWICPDCNQLVPNPVKGTCPNGHALFDGRILGSTTEQSFTGAFINALIACVVIFGLVAGLGAVLAKTSATTFDAATLVAFIVAGVVALLRGLKWKRQGGPVVRLAPRAFGMATACILAGAAPFAAGIALGLI